MLYHVRNPHVSWKIKRGKHETHVTDIYSRHLGLFGVQLSEGMFSDHNSPIITFGIAASGDDLVATSQ